MGFWILVLVAALGIVLILGYALFSPSRDTARATAEFDLAVYRDQLRELERDVARGVLSQDDAKRAEVEISRRLLEADKAVQAASGSIGAPRGASIVGIAVTAALIVGGGTWLYTAIGAPGYADLPLKDRKEIAANARESRPTQAEVEAELPEWTGPGPDVDADYVKLVEDLRTAVARRPDDPQGLSLLAQHEANIGNFRAAYAAKERLVESANNPNAVDYAELGEMMIIAANGYVSPEAEQALERSLQLDPQNGAARYYSGLMFAQTGRPDLAFRMWRVLYESSPTDSPWMAPIAAQLPDLAAAAGVNYEMPDRGVPGLSGPSPAEIAANEDMSLESRNQMIRGLAATLMSRLSEQGGTAPEWAQLIEALGLLGESERATAIWGEAQGRFGAHPADLDLIRQAAIGAGIVDSTHETQPGPSAEDIENAADMSQDERDDMVSSMVDRLATRIETEGGSPEDWARLIQVLAVQGDTERARDVWSDAQAAFDGDDAALATIRPAARAAGLAP